jgi:pimeloyl-ACP methyl ester carboxylesterase
MIRTKPHVRSSGHGPHVVLLHSSGSSGRQWDALANSLQGRFHTHAVDVHGHGRTSAWPHPRRLRLEDDAALVEPLLHAAPDGIHLVGHSYGGGVALKLATMFPEQVLSVTVYEPVLFRLLFDYHPRDRTATEVAMVGASIRNWLDLGYADRAAARFVDYWSGDGAWAAMPAEHQSVIASRMPAVAAHFHALFDDTMDMAALQQLEVPVLSLTGAGTRPTTRRLAELLRVALPRARHLILDGMGHMGPLTHANVVNRHIATFLDRQTAITRDAALLQAA